MHSDMILCALICDHIKNICEKRLKIFGSNVKAPLSLMHHKPKKPFTMSHEVLFSVVVISIVALAFILARLTKTAENINKY